MAISSFLSPLPLFSYVLAAFHINQENRRKYFTVDHFKCAGPPHHLPHHLPPPPTLPYPGPGPGSATVGQDEVFVWKCLWQIFLPGSSTGHCLPFNWPDQRSCWGQAWCRWWGSEDLDSQSPLLVASLIHADVAINSPMSISHSISQNDLVSYCTQSLTRWHYEVYVYKTFSGMFPPCNTRQPVKAEQGNSVKEKEKKTML